MSFFRKILKAPAKLAKATLKVTEKGTKEFLKVGEKTGKTLQKGSLRIVSGFLDPVLKKYTGATFLPDPKDEPADDSLPAWEQVLLDAFANREDKPEDNVVPRISLYGIPQSSQTIEEQQSDADLGTLAGVRALGSKVGPEKILKGASKLLTNPKFLQVLGKAGPFVANVAGIALKYNKIIAAGAAAEKTFATWYEKRRIGQIKAGGAKLGPKFANLTTPRMVDVYVNRQTAAAARAQAAATKALFSGVKGGASSTSWPAPTPRARGGARGRGGAPKTSTETVSEIKITAKKRPEIKLPIVTPLGPLKPVLGKGWVTAYKKYLKPLGDALIKRKLREAFSGRQTPARQAEVRIDLGGTSPARQSSWPPRSIRIASRRRVRKTKPAQTPFAKFFRQGPVPQRTALFS